MGDKKFYTAERIAEILDVHINTARRYIRTEMKYVQLGNEYRVSHDEFDRWIRAKERQDGSD